MDLAPLCSAASGLSAELQGTGWPLSIPTFCNRASDTVGLFFCLCFVLLFEGRFLLVAPGCPSNSEAACHHARLARLFLN